MFECLVWYPEDSRTLRDPRPAARILSSYSMGLGLSCLSGKATTAQGGPRGARRGLVFLDSHLRGSPSYSSSIGEGLRRARGKSSGRDQRWGSLLLSDVWTIVEASSPLPKLCYVYLIWAECLLSAIISFNPHNSVRSITVINLNLQIKRQDKERLCNSPIVMQQVSEAGLPNPCSLTLKPACSVTMLCSRPQGQEVLSAKGGGVCLMLS